MARSGRGRFETPADENKSLCGAKSTRGIASSNAWRFRLPSSRRSSSRMPSEEDGARESANRILLAVALATAAAILSLQLFVPPVVGLADNRDYERIMGYAGFQHTTADPAERYFLFLRTKYAVVAPGWFRGGYHSSETLSAFVARGVHLTFSKGPVFDLRVLGAIHAVPFLLALGGLVRACRRLAIPTQIVVTALLLFVFTDVGYVAPFNSFYSQ